MKKNAEVTPVRLDGGRRTNENLTGEKHCGIAKRGRAKKSDCQGKNLIKSSKRKEKIRCRKEGETNSD